MRKVISAFLAFMGVMFLYVAYLEVGDSEYVKQTHQIGWGLFFFLWAVAIALWKWANDDAQKKQAKLIAEAIAASKKD